MLTRVRKDKTSGVTNRTINKYFQYASQVFSWAVDRNLLHDHPWRKRKPLRLKDKFKVDLFSLQELEAIIENAPDYLAWCLEVLYHTGVRPGPSELFDLKWSDVDWKNKRIKIRGSKTEGSDRWQYLSDEFMIKLRQRYRNRMFYYTPTGKKKTLKTPCEYVVSFRGKKMTNVSKSWEAAKKDAGINRRIRMYDVRHFYITYALSMGADIADLAQRVGNSPETITRYYLHLAKDLQKKEAFEIPHLNAKQLTKAVDSTKKRVAAKG